MIRGIIFDCFGVLYGGSLSTLQAMCPPERMNDLYDVNKQSDYGFISSEQYIAGVAEILGRTYDDIEGILHQHHVRNDELVNYVKSLRATHKTALLSNVSNGIIEHLFTKEELEELFDEVLLSYREHIAKPNPEIYEMMANRLRLPAGECVMIDDIADNCEGAEIAGMMSIRHITNAETIRTLDHILT